MLHRLHSNNRLYPSMRNLLRNKASTCLSLWTKKKKRLLLGVFLSLTLLTAPPACHLLTLTHMSSESQVSK